MTLSLALGPWARADAVEDIFRRVRAHDFHPTRDGFTYDRQLEKHGVARLENDDWRVRTLAIRDLVVAGAKNADRIAAGLKDQDEQVRYLSAMALGVLRVDVAVPDLEARLRNDPDPTVRSQAAVALRQIGSKASLPALRAAFRDDPSRDVRHQAELSLHAIKTGQPATDELAKAFATLDESSIGQAKVGEPAPDFAAIDSDGNAWRLSDHLTGKKSIALIWIFADWCPVCHNEFRELIQLKEEYEAFRKFVRDIEQAESERPVLGRGGAE